MAAPFDHDGQLPALPALVQVEAMRVRALAPRKAYANVKRRKRAAWLEARERKAIETYFSRHQRHFWQWFRGGPAAPSPLGIGEWTAHFRALLAPPQGATADALGSCPPELADIQAAFFAHSTRTLPATDLQALNADITAGEVQAVLAGLKSGKSAGPDGLTNEAMRLFVCAGGDSSKALCECLAVLLNRCRLERLPAAMCLGKLVPVPKGRPSADPGQHRGIVVSSTFSRILDSILYRRGNKISNDLNLRAAAQCGFRDKHGTLDALFTVQHLVDKHRHSRRHLFATVADITKAFDHVSRQGMLDRCRRLGLHGAYAELLTRTYEDVKVAVHVGGELGEDITTTRGTKQGSELSPLIFGWFIEQFSAFLDYMEPTGHGMGMQGDCRVSHILYADDILLLADTPQGMQRLLDHLSTFCTIFGLEVNTTKTKLVCFCPLRGMGPATVHLTYRGASISQVPHFDYLGLTFHHKQGLYRSNEASALAKGRRALFALTAQLRRRHLRTPDFVRRLFNLLVEPTFSYASQIWGPDIFVKALQDPLAVGLQAIPLAFARTFWGLGSSAHRMTLLRETGLCPAFHHWLCLAVRMWNRIKGMDANRLLRQAFEDNAALARGGCQQCWVARLLAALAKLDVVPAAAAGLPLEDLLALQLDEAEVAEKLRDRFLAAWSGDLGPPRDAPSQGVLAATYTQWVGMLPDASPPHAHTSLPYALRRVLAGFRVGSHSLEIVAGRFKRPSIPRDARVCPVCAHERGAVEDVRHFVLECPLYQPVRDAHSGVFAAPTETAPSPDEQVRAIFNGPQQRELAECLRAMLASRGERLAQLAEAEAQPAAGVAASAAAESSGGGGSGGGGNGGGGGGGGGNGGGGGGGVVTRAAAAATRAAAAAGVAAVGASAGPPNGGRER